MTERAPPCLADLLRPFAKLSAMLNAKSPGSSRAILDGVREATAALDVIAPALRDAEADLAKKMATAMNEVESDLRDLAARRGWRLEGGWPTFQVERGVELRVEPGAGIVRVASKTLDASDLTAIESSIAALVPNLIPKRFAPQDFLDQIERAYRGLADRSAQVPIWDLYGRVVIETQGSRFWRDAVADRFVPLSADQFRARLSAMLEAGATITRAGLELRLLPPLDPKDALFVYNPGEQRFAYVGRIEFVAGERR